MKRLHGPYGAATPSLAEEKAALRKRMREVRGRLATTDPEAANRAARHPLHLSARVSPAYFEGAGEAPALRRRVVALYVAQGSELDPTPVAESRRSGGWLIALPRAATRDGILTFHTDDLPLQPDAFAIPAPPKTALRVDPDLVIVPALAFDRTGGRLGQGAGCYDRTIAALRATRLVRVIGLAYAEQEVERVPTDEHDEPLDGILTDAGYIEVVRAAS